MKFVQDKRIQGIVRTRTADFTKCIDRKCMMLGDCSTVSPYDIKCIHKKPLVKFSNSKSHIRREGNIIQKVVDKVLRPKSGYIHNNTNTEFLENLAKHIAGESTPTLTGSYIMTSSAYGTITNNTIIENELDRKAVSSPSRSGSSVTFSATFGLSDSNPLSTTVSVSPTPTTTVFDLADTTGLLAGDALQIGLTAYVPTRNEIREVDSVGATVTMSTGYSQAPASTEVAKVVIKRIYLLNGSATTTSGTGDIMAIVPIELAKANTQTLACEFTISFV